MKEIFLKEKIKYYGLLILIFFVTQYCRDESMNKELKNNHQNMVGVYEFQRKGGHCNENQYIILRIVNESIEGSYIGTSDEFDQAREGYKPKFFRIKIDNMKFSNSGISSISFRIKVTDSDFHDTPMDVNDKQKSKDEFSFMWEINQYFGKIENGNILINEIKGDTQGESVDVLDVNGDKERLYKKISNNPESKIKCYSTDCKC
ncbi:MAG: hypothetical protein HS129_11385 [Leptospiraceae bacterium]|nr:hypothetical protein [Leptospiraceae bacterium]